MFNYVLEYVFHASECVQCLFACQLKMMSTLSHRHQTATLSGEAFRQLGVYDEDHNTVLHLAAQRGHMEMIKRVVNEGLSLEVRISYELRQLVSNGEFCDDYW